MPSRSRLRVALGRWEPLSLTVAILVFVGLAVSGLVNVWIEAPEEGALPGVALGSQTLLVVERGAAFFAVWLAVLVISVQALKGRLPIEISGRGVRYADLDVSQDELLDSRRAIRDLDRQVEILANAVVDVEQTQAEQDDRFRRYAMER